MKRKKREKLGETTVNHRVSGWVAVPAEDPESCDEVPSVLLTDGEKGPYRPRQHCRLSICDYWLSWTNTVSEAKIQITLLILNGDPV